MEITMDYFSSEYMKFRDIMCSKKYTPEQKLDAWGGLLTVYVNVKTDNKEDKDTLLVRMQALKREFDMRLEYELFG